MTDSLKKVQSGQPMRIKAQTFNTILDATRKVQEQSHNGGRPAQRAKTDSNLVLVKNDSGADVGRFGVLGIDDILFSPTDNLEAFRNQPVFQCTTPTVGTHEGRFVIAQEPIPAGAFGRAILAGMTVARVRVLDGNEGLPAAEIYDGVTTYLSAAPVGGAQILYIQEGAGTKWAVVRLQPWGAPELDGEPYMVKQLRSLGGVLTEVYDYVRMGEFTGEEE